jgi:NitT/TauT family transport system substrate-binding protein
MRESRDYFAHAVLPELTGDRYIRTINPRTLLLSLLLLVATASLCAGQTIIRVGHFPNLTHGQALLGRSNGSFEKALNPKAIIRWKAFNAGPAVIEALFAEELDLAYIGPSPAINAFVRSNGDALRVVAGATSGGAALIVRSDSGIQKPEDFHGKRVATPQFANTQDIALRDWLSKHGLKTRERGGDVQVIPIANPDQLTLFVQKQIDAAWAPEPWATRLIREAGGKLLVDERNEWPNGQFASALVIVSKKFLDQHPDLVKLWLNTHVDLTAWINKNKADAKRQINGEIAKETGKALPDPVIDDAFSRLEITVDPVRTSVQISAKHAAELGLFGGKVPDVSKLFDLTLLNQVLTEKHLKAIP